MDQWKQSSRNFNQYRTVLIKGNAFAYLVCKLNFISFRPQCVKAQCKKMSWWHWGHSCLATMSYFHHISRNVCPYEWLSLNTRINTLMSEKNWPHFAEDISIHIWMKSLAYWLTFDYTLLQGKQLKMNEYWGSGSDWWLCPIELNKMLCTYLTYINM